MVKGNGFNFAEIVEKYLREAYDQSWEAIYESADEVSREAVKKLKQTSPKGDTGRYSKNWTRKGERGRSKVLYTVYGGVPTYRLAHLLEHGHAKRNGGRTAAIEHIKPVEEWALDEVVERFIQKMVDRT